MSGKAHPPELKKFMDKRVHLKINGNRAVEGILRGFDPFMNLVLDETIEFTKVKFEFQLESKVLRGIIGYCDYHGIRTQRIKYIFPIFGAM